MISETLNSQVDKYVLRYLFGQVPVKAYIKFIPNVRHNVTEELALYRELYSMGVPLSINDIRERFNLATPSNDETLLPPKNSEKYLTKEGESGDGDISSDAALINATKENK